MHMFVKFRFLLLEIMHGWYPKPSLHMMLIRYQSKYACMYLDSTVGMNDFSQYMTVAAIQHIRLARGRSRRRPWVAAVDWQAVRLS